jgi:effector-binding domain-containing protein
MEHEVKVGRREATPILSKRLPVRLPEIGAVLGAAFGEVYGFIGARGAEPDGPPFVIYYDAPEPDKPMDVEICAPIRRAVDPPGGWEARVLPSGMFATLLHVGPYDTIGAAYGTLMAWIGEHGLAMAGAPREVYLSEPDTPPEQVKTILEIPVTEVGAPVAAG